MDDDRVLPAGTSSSTQDSQPKSALSPKKQPPQAAANGDATHMETAADCVMFPFYMDTDVLGGSELPRVEVSVPHSYSVFQATRKALMQFSEELQTKQVEVSLDPRDFVARIAKKTGRPKMDMPGLDSEQKLSEIKINSVCLQPANDRAVQRIEKPAVPEVLPQPVKQQAIFTQIDYGTKREKEIEAETRPEGHKDKSGCFFSFC